MNRLDFEIIKNVIKDNSRVLDERYMVESIEDDFYIVVQKEGTYTHRLKLDKNQVRKL